MTIFIRDEITAKLQKGRNEFRKIAASLAYIIFTQRLVGLVVKFALYASVDC